ATYQAQGADAGKTLRIAVTAKNNDGTATATSAPTGTVAATPPPAVTLAVPTLRLVYGTAITLTGTISTKQGGPTVTIMGQAFGPPSAAALGTATTASDGTWSFRTKPTIQTAYSATWSSVSSPTITVGVKPLVTLHVITHKRF